MKPERQFNYKEREELDDYLDESKMWSDIYDIYLNVKNKLHVMKVPTLELFNEVCYQCVRVVNSKHPEENIQSDYILNACETLDSPELTRLCFAMVYAVLSVQKNKQIQVTRFLVQIKGEFDRSHSPFFGYFNEYVFDCEDNDITYDIDFSADVEKPMVKPALPPIVKEVVKESGHPVNKPDWEDVINSLLPIFKNNRDEVVAFLNTADGQKSTAITEMVNDLLRESKITKSGCKRDLWTILHDIGFYRPGESTWNKQVNA